MTSSVKLKHGATNLIEMYYREMTIFQNAQKNANRQSKRGRSSGGTTLFVLIYKLNKRTCVDPCFTNLKGQLKRRDKLTSITRF